MMFIPQQSYMPIGTLKAALAYPSSADTYTDDECREALRACHLEDYGTVWRSRGTGRR